MKRLWAWIGMAVASGLAIASVAQANRHAPARAVELIEMAPPTRIADADVIDAFHRPGQAAFVVHDLRRRWVEQQLRLALVEQARAGFTAHESVSAGSAPLFPVAGVSSIAVPRWMTSAQPRSTAAHVLPGCATRDYRPSGLLAARAEQRRRVYYSLVRKVACEFGVPFGLFDALIIRESGYDPAISSPKFAFGLTQLMSGTARALGVNRYTVEGNLRGGAGYLRQQLDRFGHYHLALAAYNAGPGRVRKGKVPAISETQTYVARVLSSWSRLEGSAAVAPTIPRIALMRSYSFAGQVSEASQP